MTSPLFRSLVLACLLAACSSSGGGPSADAPVGPGDTPVANCTSSPCTTGDATPPAVADAAPERTDTADSPPLAPEAPDGRADTPSPDAQTPDVVVWKEDAVVPDLSDAILAKADTWLPDLSDAVLAKTDAKTDTWPPDLSDAVPAKTDTSRADTAGPDSATCAQEPFVHLTPLELKTLLDGGENPFLINVKGTSIKNIPGTDAVLASDVPGIEALVKNDVCANIVLYCRSGATSQTVGSQLIAKGYRRVRDLADGITAWEAAGYPTE